MALIKAVNIPTLKERSKVNVYFHKFGRFPTNVLRKSNAPRLSGVTEIARLGLKELFVRRHFKGQVNSEKRHQDKSRLDIDEKKDPFSEDFFVGKVSFEKWARTRRQRVLEATSFDSELHDIYRPRFSSISSSDDASPKSFFETFDLASE